MTEKSDKKREKKIKQAKGKIEEPVEVGSNTQRTEETSKENPDIQEMLAKQSIEDLETLSQNLRQAAIASSRLTESLAKNAEDFAARHPRIDPLGLAPYAAEVTTKLLGDPNKYLDANRRLWEGYMNIWKAGVEGFKEGKDTQIRDKRFSGAEWQSNFMFDILRRTYLHTSGWFNGLIDEVDDIDDMTRRKARFFTQQLSNAFSPSNFLMTNPVAIKELIETKGASLNEGIRNLVSDFERGNGRLSLSQTDYSAFEVGKNIAITPGKVVYRGKLFELIQYTPTTDTVYKNPILIFPPWINKFYIMDLTAKNSLIKWLVAQGHTVFVVSWINPSQEYKDYSFDEYVEQGVLEALNQVQMTDNIYKINCVGYCIGGTLLASTMAYLAKQGDNRINSATFFASQQDFVEAGDLKIFTDDASYQFISDEIEAAGGVLDSSIMADTFNYLRSNDLVWSFVVNNYLMGKSPKPFDLLFWNSDQTRMPQKLHLFYIENMYRQNNLARGCLKIKGETINLNDVKQPIYMQSSKDDHIAPYRSIYRGARLFGGDVRMILAGSGHIAGVINHPDANKYQHWLPEDGAKLPETVDEWQETLTEHPGSWWNDWAKWLDSLGGKKVPARTPGSGDLAVICDAPGTYVLMK